MTQGKHTPGPWVWATSNSWSRLMRVGGKDGGILCPVVHQYDAHPDLSIPNEADARLIAAAPEMLEALKEAVEVFQIEVPFGSRTIAQMRAAIAKAEGAQ